MKNKKVDELEIVFENYILKQFLKNKDLSQKTKEALLNYENKIKIKNDFLDTKMLFISGLMKSLNSKSGFILGIYMQACKNICQAVGFNFISDFKYKKLNKNDFVCVISDLFKEKNNLEEIDLSKAIGGAIFIIDQNSESLKEINDNIEQDLFISGSIKYKIPNFSKIIFSNQLPFELNDFYNLDIPTKIFDNIIVQ